MISKFEDTLLRCDTNKGPLRKRLFDLLDDGISLLRLRASSRVLHDLVDHQPGRLFRNLYINALSHDKDDPSIRIVLPFCYHLTITIRDDEAYEDSTLPDQISPITRTDRKLSWSKSRKVLSRASWHRRRSSTLDPPPTCTILTTHASLQPLSLTQKQDREAAYAHWTTLFSRAHQLQTLTLRTHGDRTWPGLNLPEATLIAIRSALEHSPPPQLQHLHLTPIHALGLIHLRFSSLATFGRPPPPPSPQQPTIIWRQLHTLDLRIPSPFDKLTPQQTLVFKKCLHDYLSSFANTLRSLRLWWLGGGGGGGGGGDDAGGGPSPLTLHTEPGFENRRPIAWSQLEELWLGGVAYPYRTISLLSSDTEGAVLAPKLERLMMLRSSSDGRGGRGGAGGRGGVGEWMDVMLGKQRATPKSWAGSAASSVYSQLSPSHHPRSSSLLSYDAELGSVSSTSWIVPFMLDLGGGAEE